jgi:hypothetical protein
MSQKGKMEAKKYTKKLQKNSYKTLFCVGKNGIFITS